MAFLTVYLHERPRLSALPDDEFSKSGAAHLLTKLSPLAHSPPAPPLWFCVAKLILLSFAYKVKICESFVGKRLSLNALEYHVL